MPNAAPVLTPYEKLSPIAKLEVLERAIGFYNRLSESYDAADLPGLAQDACDTMTDLQVERDAIRRSLRE